MQKIVRLNFQFASDVFRDVDAGDSLTYTATLSDGNTLPSWLSFDAASRTFSGTPLNGDVGAIDITVMATDGSSATATDTFTLTVTNTNDAPTVTSSETMSVDEDVAYSYTFVASDVDVGDTLTLAAPTKPSWLSFNTATGVLSGTPSNDDVGTHAVVLTATDASGAADTQSFNITVSNVNDVPTITSTQLTSVTEGQAYSYTFAASDVDVGDSVTLAAPTKPSWLSFDPATGVLSGTASNDEVGDHSVVLTATDTTGAVHTQSFTITVANVNTAPEVTSKAITNATEDTAYSYTFAASDVDSGDTPTLAASTKPSWLSFDASTGVLSGTPDNAEVGDHAVVLTATDGNGEIGTQSFKITVTNTNDAPTVANAISDQTIAEDSASELPVCIGCV